MCSDHPSRGKGERYVSLVIARQGGQNTASHAQKVLVASIHLSPKAICCFWLAEEPVELEHAGTISVCAVVPTVKRLCRLPQVEANVLQGVSLESSFFFEEAQEASVVHQDDALCLLVVRPTTPECVRLPCRWLVASTCFPEWSMGSSPIGEVLTTGGKRPSISPLATRRPQNE
ncbi:unnamed protein product, partial [Ectocarpus sp. 12 AP-2014]